MRRLRDLFAKSPAGFLVPAFLVLAVAHVLVPYKRVFLSVYFLPIVLTAFAFETRWTMAAACVCVLGAAACLGLDPGVLIWAGAFLSTAFAAGRLMQALRRGSSQALELHEQVHEANRQLGISFQN